MAEIRNVVHADADGRDLTRLDEYRAVGGFRSLERAAAMEPHWTRSL